MTQKFFICWRDRKRRYVGSTAKRRLPIVNTVHKEISVKEFNKLIKLIKEL